MLGTYQRSYNYNKGKGCKGIEGVFFGTPEWNTYQEYGCGPHATVNSGVYMLAKGGRGE